MAATWVKCHDGAYRQLENYSKLYVYATGSEWALGNGTNAENIVEVPTQTEAEGARDKLFGLVGAIEL